MPRSRRDPSGQPLVSEALTAEQDARAVRALATFMAKREVLRAGLALAQLDADPWVVDVDTLDPEVAQQCPPHENRHRFVGQALR